MEVVPKEVIEVLESYMKRFRSELIRIYDEEGIRASGDYERALEWTITGSFKLKMIGAKHAGAIEYGIRPSGHRYGAVKAIERWIQNKQNLPSYFKTNVDRMKFAIAKKIANEGIEVPNEFNKGRVVSRVVDEFLGEGLKELVNELGQTYVPIIQSEVIRTFRAA